MSEERIKELLHSADAAAGAPRFDRVSAAGIRRRLRRRRVVTLGVPAAAAAVLLVGACLWTVFKRPRISTPETPPPRIVALAEQIEQLQAQTDATLRLVHEVLERDRAERHLAALEAELASIPDPMREIERQVDRAAFGMLYYADRLYNELSQTESAVEAYQEIIQVFPDNQWADVARERLSEIKKVRINKSEMKGETKCARQRV